MKWLEPVSVFDRSPEAREADDRWGQMYRPTAERVRPLAEPHVPERFHMPLPDHGLEDKYTLHNARLPLASRRQGPQRRCLTDAERAEIVEAVRAAQKTSPLRGRRNVVYTLARKYGVSIDSVYHAVRKAAA